MNYIVQPGDSLSKIARDKLGDITLWEDLAKHNNIRNASLIHPGQVISLDIPKRVTINVTPEETFSSVLKWVGGLLFAVATGVAANIIYQNEKRDDR